MATSPLPLPRARRPALIPYHEDLNLAMAAAAKYSSPMSSPVDEDGDLHMRGGIKDLRADLGDWINSPDDDHNTAHDDYFLRGHNHHQQYESVTHEQPITRFPTRLRLEGAAARLGMDSVPASPTARSSPAEVEMQLRRVAAAGRC